MGAAPDPGGVARSRARRRRLSLQRQVPRRMVVALGDAIGTVTAGTASPHVTLGNAQSLCATGGGAAVGTQTLAPLKTTRRVGLRKISANPPSDIRRSSIGSPLPLPQISSGLTHGIHTSFDIELRRVPARPTRLAVERQGRP
jgi:hypothetical protein